MDLCFDVIVFNNGVVVPLGVKRNFGLVKGCAVQSFFFYFFSGGIGAH